MENKPNSLASDQIADSQKKSLAERFFKAVTENDKGVLSEILSPQISWSFPGNSRISGVVNGIAGVMSRVELLRKQEVTVKFQHWHYGIRNLVATFHNITNYNGQKLDGYLATYFVFENNQIANIETYHSDLEEANQFFK